VPAGNVAQRIGHGDHGEAESERDTGKSDAQLRNGSGQNGSAAAAEHQPEGAEALGGKSTNQRHAWILQNSLAAALVVPAA